MSSINNLLLSSIVVLFLYSLSLTVFLYLPDFGKIRMMSLFVAWKGSTVSGDSVSDSGSTWNSALWLQ